MLPVGDRTRELYKGIKHALVGYCQKHVYKIPGKKIMKAVIKMKIFRKHGTK